MEMKSHEETTSTPTPQDPIRPDQKTQMETKLYKRRWVMLLIFCSYSATNAFQWLEYSTINNAISSFYQQPTHVVDWLGIIYELVYIPLIFPANWLLDKYGLMPVAFLGSFGNALGAILKVASARADLFWLTFLGQTVAAVAQIFVLGIPAAVAASWFGPKEVSTATALGVFGNQVGNALGFLLPPLFVPYPRPWDQGQVRDHLQTMFYTLAAITTAQFISVVLVFKGSPDVPPSVAQGLKRQEKEDYVRSMKNLFKQKNFLLIFFTYGMCVGTFYAISTLLNQAILSFYPVYSAK